jgi:hypothetical protein
MTKNILDLHAPGTRSLVTEQLEQTNVSSTFFEMLHCRKDGSLFPVEVSSVRMSLGIPNPFCEVKNNFDALGFKI